MEEQAKRSPGGKLALWALYAFLRILCLGHCALLVGSGKNSQRSRRQRGGVILEQRPGNGLAPCWVCWSSAALALFSARSSGMRVHPAASRIISAKIAMLEADPQIRKAYGPG